MGYWRGFGLINPESFTYDYTVNANHEGAISNAYATGSTVTFASQTFSISDAGLSTIDVTLDGTLTYSRLRIRSTRNPQTGETFRLR